MTRAVRPGVRMLPARQRSCGPATTGSTQLRQHRLGVDRARDDRARSAPRRRPAAPPSARPSRVVTRSTAAPVRISTPAAVAAAASASVTRRWAAARVDALARSTAVVSGRVVEQHERRARRPRPHRREAGAARSERRAHASDSNHSPPGRRPPSAAPASAHARAWPQAAERAAQAQRTGRRRPGRRGRAVAGSWRSACPGTPPACARARRTPGSASASAAEWARSSSAVRSALAPERERRLVGPQREQPRLGLDQLAGRGGAAPARSTS